VGNGLLGKITDQEMTCPERVFYADLIHGSLLYGSSTI
jgi:hypothetical protein